MRHNKSTSSQSPDRGRPWRVGYAMSLATVIVAMVARAETRQAPRADSRLAEVQTAEANGRYDAALDLLYTLELEHPRTPAAVAGRAELARLLALRGDLSSAILQAQALRDESTHEAIRKKMLDFATLVARRLRAKSPSSLYSASEPSIVRGLTDVDEPTGLTVLPDGALLLVDSGAKRLYRIAAGLDTATRLLENEQTRAAAALADGTPIVGVKTGLVAISGEMLLPKTGTWDNKPRRIHNIRSIAVNSRNDLFVVDGDYDKGLLRCEAGATSCAPWVQSGALRAVKTGPSDFILTLDDKDGVRIYNDHARLVATLSPMAGNLRLDDVAGIAMDSAYGIYRLDAKNRRVVVDAMRLAADGTFTADLLGIAAIPADDRGLKNPSALAVTAEGEVVVAERGTSRFLRLR